MQLENLVGLQKGNDGENKSSNSEENSGSQIAATFVSHIDPSLTWSFVKWVRSITKMPVWVKVKPSFSCHPVTSLL